MSSANSMISDGERAVSDQFQGGWSPSSRMLMSGVGAGLFVYALTKDAPMACILGTLGALMVAEGLTNADLSDLAQKAMDVGVNVGTGGMAAMA